MDVAKAGHSDLLGRMLIEFLPQPYAGMQAVIFTLLSQGGRKMPPQPRKQGCLRSKQMAGSSMRS